MAGFEEAMKSKYRFMLTLGGLLLSVTASYGQSRSIEDQRSLKSVVGDRFKIGVGVSERALRNDANVGMIRRHFRILTPENCMKPQGIHPAEDEWNFAATDRFAEFARTNQLELVGHCLVWAKDDRTDAWMMREDGKDVSRETLLRRIETHIESVVQRYADVATEWDVVNEALKDGGEDLLRDSVYSRTTGSDFIVAAFKAARRHDPDALLVYNDYNGHKPGKRRKLLELLTRLKSQGAPVDAYGMQGHFELGDNSIPQLRETFDELRKLGLKVVVSELDIDVVTRGKWWADGGKDREELASYDPYKDGLPKEVEQRQIQQYVALFELFDDYRDIIARVSFWNPHDGESWLNYFPWRRVNHPLLFDRDRKPKLAFDAVYNTLEKRRAGSPLVYPVEHTGDRFPAPELPAFADLPRVEPLTDPFMWSDGSGRVARFDDWSRRRAEIKAEFERYEIGTKPARPRDITASYADGALTVKVTVNGESLTLTSAINLPDGDGPFPAVIGIGRGSGSLPRDVFESRRIALIPFDFRQVMSHTQKRGEEPINRLYPDLIPMGAYSAWPWGISRLIDGLELVKDDLPIDLKRLAVTGCSFAGKMALFGGALDERIALTIAQEPGGGGAAAWRVSETLGRVETLGATSRAWFMESMFQFSGGNVARLPMDHHELMALVAPRALLVLGNPDYAWLAEESGYVSCRAAHEVWKKFGIGDRFGFSIVAGHGHCRLPDSQRPEVEAFVDKFLLGMKDAKTDVTISPYDDVDHTRWIDWWGTGEPALGRRNMAGIETVTFEAEGASVGSNWEILNDAQASDGRYVTAISGVQSIQAPPTETRGVVSISFSVKSRGSYAVFARVNCPSADDDSFWVRMDDGDFAMFNGLGTSGWSWVKLSNFRLTPGEHTLAIGYREDGAKLDKISVSNDSYSPVGMGAPAENARAAK